MIFNTPLFFAFFMVFLILYGFLILRQTPRIYFILVSSLVFYGAWNYSFIPLLVGSAVADYFIAQAIHGTEAKGRRRLLLGLSITINLGILAVFKYADFAMASLLDLFGAVGIEMTPIAFNFILPVGISFYTFQSMSYTIDVYRGHMEPRKGLVAFTSALAFFPQLVAGPILRAREILPQMHNIPTPTWDQAKHGFVLITAGLAKKTMADLLAGPAAKAFDGDSVSLIETWTGVLAFAGQIYGDFAGYSDMAIGFALLLGFKIPLNFRLPYFAVSPVDFWRRWHISLSSWLRDYLYISLGGNRTGHRQRNIFITMLLGGLWHGAAWTFVAWGAFHGAIISATHALSKLPGMAMFGRDGTRVGKLVSWAVTFYLILLGWVLFRAVDLSTAWRIMVDMHTLAGLPAAAPAALNIFIGVTLCLILMHLIDAAVIHGHQFVENRKWILWPALLTFQTLCLFIGEPSDAFIYFQF